MTKHSIPNVLFWLVMAVLWAIMAYDSFSLGKNGMMWLQIILCVGCCAKGLWGRHKKE